MTAVLRELAPAANAATRCPAAGVGSRDRGPSATPSQGFTAVELAVVLAVVAMLAAIAIPSYAQHLQRARLTEALTRLADQRVRMEQYFLDNRRYDDGAGGCGPAAMAATATDRFAVECTATATSFTLAAVGIPGRGMQDFAFTVDEANNRRTPSLPQGWQASDICWVIRHDGACGG